MRGAGDFRSCLYRHRRVVDQLECGFHKCPSPSRDITCQKRLDIDRGIGASGSTFRNAATIETPAGKEPIMSASRHLASPIAKSFSEAVRIDTEAGSWIFVAGQVGVAIPSDNKPISFKQQVRVTFDRARDGFGQLPWSSVRIIIRSTS